MKIKYTERDRIRRFGRDPIEVTDETGAKLLEEGVAIAVTSFDSPPLDDVAKIAAVSSKGQRRVVGSGLEVHLKLGGFRILRSMVGLSYQT